MIHPSSATALQKNNSDSTTTTVTQSVPTTMSGSAFSGNVADASAKIGAIKGGEVELVLYQKVSLGTGTQANNPWLQELPDPISKATWDNYAMISPAMGKSLFGIDIFRQKGYR